MSWPSEVIIYTDGASRGNPGPAALGIYVTNHDGEVIHEYGEKLGLRTNNFAEYTAVLRALSLCVDKQVENLILRSDSQLLVRQLLGQYKVKSADLRPLYEECQSLLKSLPRYKIEHVRREFNTEADRLANQALDQA